MNRKIIKAATGMALFGGLSMLAAAAPAAARAAPAVQRDAAASAAEVASSSKGITVSVDPVSQTVTVSGLGGLLKAAATDAPSAARADMLFDDD